MIKSTRADSKKYSCCSDVSLVSGTITVPKSISLNSVKIESGSKSPIKATTSPCSIVIFEGSSDGDLLGMSYFVDNVVGTLD